MRECRHNEAAARRAQSRVMQRKARGALL